MPAPIPGTSVIAPIVPDNEASVYPTHYSKYGKGGHVEVNNINERDAIAIDRRTEGMKVYVQNEGNTYYLKNGITNAHWTNLLFTSAEVNPTDSLGHFGLDQRQFNIVPKVISQNCNLYGLNFSFDIDPDNSGKQFGEVGGGGLTFINALANHNSNGEVGSGKGINISYFLGDGTSSGNMSNLTGISLTSNINDGYTLGNYVGVGLFENLSAGSSVEYYNGLQVSPNISSEGLQYVSGLNLAMQFNSSINGGINIINSNPSYQAGASAQYLVEIQCGGSFYPGSVQQDYRTVNVSPNFLPGSGVGNFTGINVAPNSPSIIQGSATGINVNMNNVTLASGERIRGMQISGGTFEVYTPSTSKANLFIDSINLNITEFTVEEDAPITNTDILLNNASSLINIFDDYSSGPMGLGIVRSLVGGQLSVAAGKSVQSITNLASGMSVPGQQGDGGTLEAQYDFRAVGILDGGDGNLNVINYYAYFMEALSSNAFPPSNSWGLYIADPMAENFLKKSLVIGGTSGKVSNSSIALQIADKKALKLTPMTSLERNSLVPEEGMIIASDKGTIEYYDGSAWKKIALL